MKSIIQNKKECYFCKETYNLHEHHIMHGSNNRKLSEKYGLKIWLCPAHHNMSNQSVHYNKALDLMVKRLAQKKFMEKYKNLDFKKIFYKNYIWE
jgi:hypothetical protein